MRSVSLAMVVLLCAVGCGGAGIRVSTAPKTPRRPLLLWRVTAPGVAPTYLFGTCHAGVSLDRGLPADHRAALDNARVVALEVDGESVLDPRQIMSALMLPEDQSLRALVGEGLWRELVRQLPNTGLRWMAIDRFHPFMATAMLSLAASGASRGAAHEDGMETTIARRARARGVRVAGLETVADQIRLVTGQQPSASVPALRTTLEHPREAGTMMRAVFFACAWGSDEMITLATHDSPDAIFAARNAVWLPRVELYVRDGGAFIAVGAGHLVGPTGLVASLTGRGYRIERLVSNAEDDPGFALSIRPGSASSSGSPSLESSSPPSASPPAAQISEATPWVTEFSTRFADMMCAFPAARTCIAADPGACTARYRLAVRWCSDELAPGVPTSPTHGEGARAGGELGACAQASLAMIAHMRDEWRTHPECDTDAYWTPPPAASPAGAPGSARPPRRH